MLDTETWSLEPGLRRNAVDPATWEDEAKRSSKNFLHKERFKDYSGLIIRPCLKVKGLLA